MSQKRAGIYQKVDNDVYEPLVGLRDIDISEKRNTAVERTSLGTKGAEISQKVENDVYEPLVGLRDIDISEKRNTAVERTSLGTKGAGISQKVENDVYEPSVRLRDIDISEKRNTAVERTSLGTKDDGTKHAEEEFNSQLNNELRLVLIGRTGVGKSSTGNTILGNVSFKAKGSLKSVTTHSQSQSRQWESKKVVVIDTPGLYDNQRSMADVKRELIRCIGMSYPGPHSFLYVISASSRQTPEEDAAFKEFVKTFGEQVYDFLIIIFVKKDELEAQTFKDFLKEELTDSLLKNVKKIGEKRCFWLNNKALEKEQETVECILKTINDHIRHLPKSYYTNTMLKRVLRPLTRKIVELQFKITPQAIRNKIEEGGALYEYLYAAGGVSLGAIGGAAAAIILTPKCAIL